MKSHALAPALLLLASACGDGGRYDAANGGSGGGGGGDYAAVITWAINGMLPNPALCAEQGISRGRLEVRTENGRIMETLETDCADTVVAASDDLEFGGFVTTYAFRWGVPYRYTVSLVDQNGRPRADPISGSLYETYYEEYELPTIDYLQPAGNVATLYGEWSVNNDPNLASAATCGDIATVQLLVSSILDTEFANELPFLEAPCADGKLESQGKALATGAYVFRYAALGPRGNVVQVGEPIEVLPEDVASGDVLLPRQNFLPGRSPPLMMQNN